MTKFVANTKKKVNHDLWFEYHEDGSTVLDFQLSVPCSKPFVICALIVSCVLCMSHVCFVCIGSKPPGVGACSLPSLQDRPPCLPVL